MKQQSLHSANLRQRKLCKNLDSYLSFYLPLLWPDSFLAVFFHEPQVAVNLCYVQAIKMDRRHSTLELVRYDETARAQERDHGAKTFELDTSAMAPQISNMIEVALFPFSFMASRNFFDWYGMHARR